MGCASSSFLEEDKEGSSGGGHHIVSLTSTTYGLLTTLDANQQSSVSSSPPPPPPPPPRSRSSSQPEVINSWELMEDLELDVGEPTTSTKGGENYSSDGHSFSFPLLLVDPLASFEGRCPPGGKECVVLYTTTLRGVRRTYEECNAVRAALEGLGVWVKERDVSMDVGFREELRGLMEGTGDGCSVPKVFVRGRYVGGAEEVLRLQEEGRLAAMVEGIQRRSLLLGGCEGCGGSRFLPCFRCSGSRKVVVVVGGGGGGGEKGRRRKGGGAVVRCPECNENGLVLCPICC